VESHEINIISKNITGTPEGSSIAQAVRHVVLFIVDVLID